tara:strand:+ start:712 stop:894 length:183 start_codon:yes stop_codon:yes gene_type:complete
MQGGRNVHITIGGVIPFNLIKLVTKFESCFYLENNKIMKMRMLRIGIVNFTISRYSYFEQ